MSKRRNFLLIGGAIVFTLVFWFGCGGAVVMLMVRQAEEDHHAFQLQRTEDLLRADELWDRGEQQEAVYIYVRHIHKGSEDKTKLERLIQFHFEKDRPGTVDTYCIMAIEARLQLDLQPPELAEIFRELQDARPSLRPKDGMTKAVEELEKTDVITDDDQSKTLEEE